MYIFGQKNNPHDTLAKIYFSHGSDLYHSQNYYYYYIIFNYHYYE